MWSWTGFRRTSTFSPSLISKILLVALPYRSSRPGRLRILIPDVRLPSMRAGTKTRIPGDEEKGEIESLKTFESKVKDVDALRSPDNGLITRR